MNDLLLGLLPHIRQGRNCAQLLLVLAQEATGQENNGLLQAALGLGHGIGQSGGPCGLLTGGALALAWLATCDSEESQPMMDAMLHDYAVWFMERTSASGIGCDAIVTNLAAQTGQNLEAGAKPPMNLCGDLLCECWAKMLELGEAYRIRSLGF